MHDLNFALTKLFFSEDVRSLSLLLHAV